MIGYTWKNIAQEHYNLLDNFTTQILNSASVHKDYFFCLYNASPYRHLLYQ